MGNGVGATIGRPLLRHNSPSFRISFIRGDHMKHFRKRADIPALTWTEARGALPRATLDGSRRALIENHRGIIEFSCERIRLASALGEISVVGTGLCLSQVRKDCLIILGRIDSIIMPEGSACDGC